jgi:hypothetical protein
MKKGVMFGVLLALVFVLGIVSVQGASVSVSDFNSTMKIVSISNADNLYAYEVTLTYTGNAPSQYSSSNGFLGAGTSFGGKDNTGTYTVYESRLDNTKTGVSGSGSLFNITFDPDGSLTLNDALFVGNAGGEEEVSYSSSSSSDTTSTTTTSPGGGGGSSAVTIPVEEVSIDITPEAISVDVLEGETQRVGITFKNNVDKTYTLTLEQEGLDEVLNIPNQVILNPGKEYTINADFFGATKKLTTGSIVVKSGEDVVTRIPVVVNIRSENFLFDASIALGNQFSKRFSGDKITAQIDLKEVRALEKVDVVATYVIKDFQGNIYLEESETFFVEGTREFFRDFETSGLKPGRYVLGLEIVYPGAFATSSAQFEVQGNAFSGFGDIGIYWYIVGGIAVLVVVLVVVWALRGKSKIKRKRRK